MIRTIDLQVPSGWNECTTEQLEAIATETMLAQARALASRYYPFDWLQVKVRLFLRFAGLEILSVETPAASEAAVTYIVRRRTSERGHEQEEPFPLASWQLLSFVTQHLSWLDDGKPLPLLLWPYPKRLWTHWSETPGWHIPYPHLRRRYLHPGELLDGLTWQTYRWINDWLTVYTDTANALVEERQRRDGGRPSELRRLTAEEQRLRRKILALITGSSEWRIRLFRFGNDVEWQVVMYWWSSMMHYLQSRYPKCFKQSTVASRQPSLPIELYTRSTATLQKYIGGVTEADINRQTAHAILQHLHDMAVEAEQMERISRRNRSK